VAETLGNELSRPLFLIVCVRNSKILVQNLQHLLSRQPQDLQETCQVARTPKGEPLVAPLDQRLSLSLWLSILHFHFPEIYRSVCTHKWGNKQSARERRSILGHTQSKRATELFHQWKPATGTLCTKKAKVQEQALTALSSR